MKIKVFKNFAWVVILLPFLLIQNGCELAQREVKVMTLDATEVSHYSVRLNGAVIDVGNSGLSKYGFEYADGTGGDWKQIDLGQMTTADTFSYLLEINPSIQYIDYYAFAESIEEDDPFLSDIVSFGKRNEGESGDVFYVYLYDIPPAVEVDSITNITGTSAIVHYVIRGLTNTIFISNHGIKWSPVNDQTSVFDITVDSDFSMNNDNSFSAEITGLDGNTKYEVWSFASDENGLGNSKKVSFTTITTTPTVITNIDDYTHNSADVGGDVDNGGLDISDMGVWYGKTASPETTGTKVSAGTGKGIFNTSLTALDPSTKYYVKAYATNSLGTSYGEEMNFVTWYGSVSDYDDNSYGTVLIGTQVWMAENLKTTHYADGTAIPLVEDNNAWVYLGNSDKAMCYYDNSDANRDIYGGLYTWAAAMNESASSNSSPSGVQGVCPDGWHLPSWEEWNTLIDYVGSYENGAGKLKETGTTHWSYSNGTVTNETRFTALPGGMRYADSNGNSTYIGKDGIFWSSTDNGSESHSVSIRLFHNNDQIYPLGYGVRNGMSVRCVKD